VRIRIGLNSGPVVVGAIGDDLRMDYTAAGDTTHLAARLQSTAAPGEILCGEATVTAAHGAIEVVARPAVSLKGFLGSVVPYQLLSAREFTGRSARVQAGFVGRTRELVTLLAAAQRASAGHGGVVELQGEAGAGKSRLVGEFMARIQGGRQAIRAQCISYGSQRPNVPIVELARGLLQAASARSASPLAGSEYLAALAGEPRAAGALDGVDPATLRGRTQKALLDHVTVLARDAPLVLVVEDLHWADPSTLDYLGAIAGVLAGNRALLVVTFRPGSDPPWPASWRLSRLQLQPLAEDEATVLLTSLLPPAGLAADRQARLLARAEGNPFFIEELVRSTAANGDELPADVFDVLASRIDRLDAAAKQQLRMASVMGREFSFDMLEEIASGPRRLLAGLEQLMDLGFVEPASAPRRYRFVHALTQEVAYQGMLSDERRELHSTVAARLAATAVLPEDDCEEIARHHLLGRTPAAALPFLELATAKAIRAHTLEAAYGYVTEAMSLFEAAMSTADDVVRCVSYLLSAFPVFHFLHRHREYSALLERCRPAVEALGMPALSGPFLAQRGHRLWVEARYDESEQCLLRAVTLCDEARDPVNAAHASFMLGWLYANRASYTEGARYSERSLGYLGSAPLPMFATFAHIGLLLAAAYRGRWPEARQLGEHARTIALAGHDEGMASFAGSFLAWVSYEAGDDDACVAHGNAALAIAPTDYFRGWAATFMAAGMARSGQTADAIRILDQAVGYAAAAGHVSGYALVALLRGEARIHAQEFETAWREMDELRTLVQAMPYPYVHAGSFQVQAECALRTGRPAEALRLFERAWAEFSAIDASHRAELVLSGAQRAREAMAHP